MPAGAFPSDLLTEINGTADGCLWPLESDGNDFSTNGNNLSSSGTPDFSQEQPSFTDRDCTYTAEAEYLYTTTVDANVSTGTYFLEIEDLSSIGNSKEILRVQGDWELKTNNTGKLIIEDLVGEVESSAYTLTESGFCQITVVYASSAFTVYINGVSRLTWSRTITGGTAALQIMNGAQSYIHTAGFIPGYAASLSDAQALYNSGSGTSPNVSSIPNQVTYYCDSVSGSDSNDGSDSDNAFATLAFALENIPSPSTAGEERFIILSGAHTVPAGGFVVTANQSDSITGFRIIGDDGTTVTFGDGEYKWSSTDTYNWAWVGVEFITNHTSQVFLYAGSGAHRYYFKDCTFTANGSASYVITEQEPILKSCIIKDNCSIGCRNNALLIDCELRGSQTTLVSNGTLFLVRTKIDDFRYGANLRFVLMDHVSFYQGYSLGNNYGGLQSAIHCCVLDDAFLTKAKLIVDYSNNIEYSVSTHSSEEIYSVVKDGTVAGTAALLADPANNDFTPSAEVTSNTPADNLTLGAIQAAAAEAAAASPTSRLLSRI